MTGRQTPRIKHQSGGWTAQFFCLSSAEQMKTPNSTEKEILHKGGLGHKKIKLNNTLSEEDVIEIIQSKDGFMTLKDCGGFELLRTLQNGRTLVPVPGPWTSKDLKMNVGAQARIYIRPIQHDLSIVPIVSETEPSVKVRCDKCSIEFSVHKLRDHVKICGRSNIVDNANVTRHVEVSNTDTNQTLARHVEVNNTNINQTIAGHVEVNNTNINQTLAGHVEVNNTDSYQTIAGHVEVNNTSIDQFAFDSVGEFIQHHSGMEIGQPGGLPETHVFFQVFPQGLPEVENDHVPVNELPDIKSHIDKPFTEVVQTCILYCKQNSISNPVEMLKKIQQEIILGRALEVEDSETSIEGDTTFITVDRNNLLDTSVEEIRSLTQEELRTTLEVQFYNEVAADYGGPRKEFFRLVLIEIKERYFDHGIRDLLAADYHQLGILMALSILQNGKMPVFLSPEQVEEIFDDTAEPESPALKNLRQGLNVLGLFDLFVGLPELRFLLQPSKVQLTIKKLTTMLRPTFAPEGSNVNFYEKEVYSQFIKYLREVSAGRRGKVTLGSILIFVTSTDEEPTLGFKIHPSMEFCEVMQSFLPTASTCLNKLTMPRPNQSVKLPSQEDLFNLYDYAFANTNYGLM